MLRTLGFSGHLPKTRYYGPPAVRESDVGPCLDSSAEPQFPGFHCMVLKYHRICSSLLNRVH